MANEAKYAFRNITINDSDWTAIVVPSSMYFCSGFSLVCESDAIYMRTDPNDSASQIALALGATEYVLASPPRWGPGETILWVMAETMSSVSVIAQFIS